jgi:hypothetical protein
MALTLACATVARAQDAAGADVTASAVQPAQTDGAMFASANTSSLPDAPTANAQSSTAASSASGTSSYEPITGEQRLWWAFIGTVGPKSLLIAGPFSAAIGTATNHPHEYGPHWEGFGDRYGMRLTGVATSNLMEVGLGAIWGEDPRYQRQPDKGFGGRVWSVVEQGFIAKGRDGNFHAAYARYMAITGSNFLTNAWRVDSEADTAHALGRTGYGFAARIGGNAWDEFWPDIKSRVFHK